MTEPIHQNITEEILNKKVKLKGLTANSKAGACIKLESDIVFIQEKFGWDDEELNKNIIASGTLVEKKFIPDPIVDEDGAISQGAEGTQFVLEDIQSIEFI